MSVVDVGDRVRSGTVVQRHGERGADGERVLAGDAATALSSLRTRGIAGDDAFTVGSTLTVPLHDRTAAHAISAIHDADLAASSISTRQPTLDDVYLQLTGARLADAA